jgi:HAD superfamily hydrolase (TIGR01509 family)
MVKALLFDFDGLLFDTETPEYDTWRAMYARHGQELPFDRWTAAIGLAWGSYDPCRELVAMAGGGLDPETIRVERRQAFHGLLAQQGLMPGVEQYLADARRLGLACMVVSSSPRHWVTGHLDRLGTTVLFDHLICAEDAERLKPAPDLYLTALDRAGIQADEAVAFEDSVNGMLAATRAGVYCVIVPNPITRHLAFPDAHLLITSLEDEPLERVLRRVQGDGFKWAIEED